MNSYVKGKTSILSTLLRLYPIESGKILVDEVEISQIELQRLRSSIAVIPQDPVLLQGTIRYNLDPFDQYTDDEIWTALERTQLKSSVSISWLKLNSSLDACEWSEH